MKRTPLNRGTSELKRSPLNPVSAKRKAENVTRAKAMAREFGHPSAWRCAVKDNPEWDEAMGACFGPVHGHEIVKRSQGGSIVDMSNVVLLCNYHNGLVETERELAHRLGLVRSNWEGK